jgi:hypothetical protein
VLEAALLPVLVTDTDSFLAPAVAGGAQALLPARPKGGVGDGQSPWSRGRWSLHSIPFAGSALCTQFWQRRTNVWRKPASLAFGIPPIRPLFISPAARATRHAAAAASSPMGCWMDGGVTGRAEAGMGGSRISRHVSPDMHQDNYKIRPIFYGELIRPAQFSPWLGKNLAARLRAWATLKSRSGV